MKITKETVENVANLARLSLSEDAVERFTHDLGDILAYVDKLSELDTENVRPTQHVLNIKNVFRADEAGESCDREKILSNAPVSENGCFIVPKVVE
jgi:aspartyl-tRNA(Asn)/glutamyl-tRNA(Gln) amidotransferase subunit C